MTVTEAPPAADPPPGPEADSRRRHRAVIWVALALAAIAVAAFALGQDGRGNATITTRDVAATRQAQQACQQWFDANARAAAQAPGWCGYMADWMHQQMASGQRGSMMWGNPTAMYDTCVQAMGSYQPRVADPARWCQTMVDGMRNRLGTAGDWPGWMMHPSMMGR